MSRYRWNGQDPYTEYNLIIERGIDGQLLQMPALKDNGLTTDWADENGKERYNGMRRFEERTVSVSCTMECSSEQELLTSYDALEQFLLNSDEFNFDDLVKNRRWKVFYSRMTSLVRIGNSARFTIELIDNYPAQTFTAQS